MAEMKLIPFEDILDDFYGKIGTPKRDDFEKRVEEAVNAYRLGVATATLDLGTSIGKLPLW